MSLLISTITETLLRCEISPETLTPVLEVYYKGLQSCASEPLKNQSKYLLNTFLSARTWTREQRLASLDHIRAEEVSEYARRFLDSVSLECLFYGSISKQQAQEITDILIDQRAEYVERRGAELGVKVEVNPVLEEWFSKDPVERIVNMESSIQASRRLQESINQESSPRRTPSPSIRFEEPEEQESEILLPLGTNSVVVHNEQHTMSMLLFYLQLDNPNLEKHCLLEVFTHIVRERIINKLRHVVILGYVIGCDIRQEHDRE